MWAVRVRAEYDGRGSGMLTNYFSPSVTLSIHQCRGFKRRGANFVQPDCICLCYLVFFEYTIDFLKKSI